MVPTGGIRERYQTQVGLLWSGLASALPRLERIASDPGLLEDDDVQADLRRLQYRLHVASEEALGLAPPSDVEQVHAELAAALAAARDATAELAEALDEDGVAEALLYVHEWRGALFRVRLARLRLAPPAPAPSPARLRVESLRAPLLATALVLAGVAAFTVGAVDVLWPLWVAGLLAVASSFLVFRA